MNTLFHSLRRTIFIWAFLRGEEDLTCLTRCIIRPHMLRNPSLIPHLFKSLKRILILSLLSSTFLTYAADPTSEAIEKLTKMNRLKTIQINTLMEATNTLINNEKPKDLYKDANMAQMLRSAKELHKNGLELFALVMEQNKTDPKKPKKKPMSDYLRKNYAMIIQDMEMNIERVMQGLSSYGYMDIGEAEQVFYIKGYLLDPKITQTPYSKMYFDRVAQLISHLRLPGGRDRLGRKLTQDLEASPDDIADNFLFGNEGDFIRYTDISAYLQ